MLASLALALLAGCQRKSEPREQPWQVARGPALRFELSLDPGVYRLSDFGEPPQMALWLEDRAGTIRTVWVTRRMAKADWVGKVEAPTALPYWSSRREVETGGHAPSAQHPLPDAMTGATPNEALTVHASVDPGSRWHYYLELNVSGDYNESHPRRLQGGEPDPDGNGQPSLVYSGLAEARVGWTGAPVLHGRTAQLAGTSELRSDLHTITTARSALEHMAVSYIPPAEQR